MRKKSSHLTAASTDSEKKKEQQNACSTKFFNLFGGKIRVLDEATRRNSDRPFVRWLLPTAKLRKHRDPRGRVVRNESRLHSVNATHGRRPRAGSAAAMISLCSRHAPTGIFAFTAHCTAPSGTSMAAGNFTVAMARAISKVTQRPADIDGKISVFPRKTSRSVHVCRRIPPSR